MILLDKINCGDYSFYKIHDINKFKDMLKEYGLQDLDICLQNVYYKDFDIVVPKIFLNITTFEPEYDYDWEENLEYVGSREISTYIPIEYSMINGKKIETSIIDINSIDNDKITNLLEEYVRLERKTKRLNKKETRQLYSIIRELLEMFKDIPYIIDLNSDEEIHIYNKDELVSIDNFLKIKAYERIKE